MIREVRQARRTAAPRRRPFLGRRAREPFFGATIVQRRAASAPAADPLEREAEAVAERVHRSEGVPDAVSAPGAPCAKPPIPAGVQRSAAGGNQLDPAPPGVASEIEARRGSGRPLSSSERAFYEPRLGADLARVRLHSDAPAAEMAATLRAKAFTSGQDVFFGSGQSSGSGGGGNRLLAHELVHTVQQGAAPSRGVVQRQEFGPATGAPADWSTQVTNATTSAKKAALVQQATGITTVDVTATTSGDAKVDKTKLSAYESSSQKINYDDGLNSKKSIGGRKLTRNAGYTINSSKSYVVLGPKSLDGDSYFLTRRILSHEFDHVRQAAAGSKLTGKESELDAWTSSFIRDFHRSYVLKKSGTTCYIQSNPQWNPLLEYYVHKDVSATEQDNAVKRIKAYYKATIEPHAAHKIVFTYWIHRMLQKAGATYDDLPERLNKDLALAIDPAAKLKTTRQFDCSAVAGVTYPKAPEVAKP